MKSVKGT